MVSLRSALLASVVAVLVVQTPLAAVAAVAPGGIGIRLLDAPLSASHDPRAQEYIVDQLAPGTVITRHVQLTNTSRQVLDASVYPAAASIDGGQFRFADGRTANDLTSWTTVSPSTSVLAPGTKTTVTVRIAVPRDAVSGEQYAVIWAQVASPGATGSVRQINRVGVRIYLDVSGSRHASSFSITSVHSTRDAIGRPKVVAQVRNTGPRAVDVSGTVALSDGPGGLQTGPRRADATETIAPGTSHSVSVTFDRRLQAGPWLATVRLTSGTVHDSATATLTFATVISEAVAAPPLPSRHSSNASWAAVAAALAALLLLGSAIGLVHTKRKRRRRATLA